MLVQLSFDIDKNYREVISNTKRNKYIRGKSL